MAKSRKSKAPKPKKPVVPPPSYAEVYHRQFQFLWHCLRRFGVPAAALEGVVLDVLVQVHQKLPDFDAIEPVQPWLCNIAFAFVSENQKSDFGAEPQSGIQDDADARDRQSVIAALGLLSEDRRKVLVVSELHGMPDADAATVLAIPAGRVASRKRVAREELRTALSRVSAAAMVPGNQETARLLDLERAVPPPDSEAEARVRHALEQATGEALLVDPLAAVVAASEATIGVPVVAAPIGADLERTAPLPSAPPSPPPVAPIAATVTGDTAAPRPLASMDASMSSVSSAPIPSPEAADVSAASPSMPDAQMVARTAVVTQDEDAGTIGDETLPPPTWVGAERPAAGDVVPLEKTSLAAVPEADSLALDEASSGSPLQAADVPVASAPVEEQGEPSGGGGVGIWVAAIVVVVVVVLALLAR